MSILITGNHGFIGFWLNIYLQELLLEKLIGLDNISSFENPLYYCKKSLIEAINCFKKFDYDKLSPWDLAHEVSISFMQNTK